MNEFLYGIDTDMFRNRRLAYLKVTKQDITEIATKYLSNKNTIFKDVVFGNCQNESVLDQLKTAGWKIDDFASKLGGGEEEDSESD